jgi:hypothetical protein
LSKYSVLSAASAAEQTEIAMIANQALQQRAGIGDDLHSTCSVCTAIDCTGRHIAATSTALRAARLGQECTGSSDASSH